MPRKDDRERVSLSEKLNRHLDITPDVLPHGSLIELRGRKSLSVTGCGKILEYTPEKIRVALKKDELCISGCRLLCTSYHRGEIGIDGVIESVSFRAREDK